MAIVRREIVCPYCKNEFSIWFDLEQCIKPDYTELVYCDQEETNGCGNKFIVKPEIELILNLFVAPQEIANERA